MSFLQACGTCRYRGKPQGGRCACTVDGRDIREHAKSGECPKGRFAQAQPDPRERLTAEQAFGCKGCGQG